MEPETYNRLKREIMVKLSRDCIGRRNAISRRDLLHYLRGAFVLSERELRLAIHELRRGRHCILSTGGMRSGYWIAETQTEVDEYLEREVHSRATDLLEQERIIRRAAARRFGPQMPLPLE